MREKKQFDVDVSIDIEEREGCWPSVASFALTRWDIGVPEAVILGAVDAFAEKLAAQIPNRVRVVVERKQVERRFFDPRSSEDTPNA